MPDEPKIVEAVGTAVHSDVPGLAEALEQAMSLAVLQAMDAGVSLSDTAAILRAKMEARERVLDEWNG